jgi:phosphopantetheinyl transferase (holo-ACP synthase)
MVGNDVVDLGDSEARAAARHPRFDSRVFAPSELRWIDESDDDHLLRWSLWAAKESAYKIARRRDPRTVFAPSRFVIERAASRCIRVHHERDCYPVTVSVRGGCVHAVASFPRSEASVVLSGAEPHERGPDAEAGRAARSLAITRVAAWLCVDPSCLWIERDGRIPRLRRRDDGRDVAPLSLSHHGRFVAFACALPERGAEALT